ncbi:MAG: hypothetical protein QNJ46_11510 [Leptolyngbyaceae cyanobacterium MO_188.B28]|nr:hypothetical protein [Leptolyngbyaceae cyanobacterium MO_188.B28]
MVFLDRLIDITLFSGLSYIGISAVLHAIKWTERYAEPTPSQPLMLPAKVGEPLKLEKQKELVEAEKQEETAKAELAA